MIKKLMLLFLVSILIFPISASAGDFVSVIAALTSRDGQYGVIRASKRHLSKEVDPVFPPCAEKPFVLYWDKTTPHGKDMWDLARQSLARHEVRFEYDDEICSFDGNRLKLVNITLYR